MTPPGGSERIGRLAPRDRIQVGILLGLALALLPPAPGPAQSLQVQPPFDSAYSVTDLGPPPGVPPRLGGLTPRVGTPDRLLIGGQANDSGGGLYEIGSVRDVAGHLIGFSGPAVRFADAANNDGGVTYGPGGVLFLARWPNNELAQAKPGSTSTEDHPACAARRNGIAGSDPVHTTGPARRRVVQARGLSDGQWYDADVVPDDTRTYDVVNLRAVPGAVLPGGPEGIVHVPAGSPQFCEPSLLVSKYGGRQRRRLPGRRRRRSHHRLPPDLHRRAQRAEDRVVRAGKQYVARRRV